MEVITFVGEWIGTLLKFMSSLTLFGLPMFVIPIIIGLIYYLFGHFF